MAEGVDVLFGVRNAFYIGNFQQCVSLAQALEVPTKELKEERDVYMYRAMIAQGKYAVVKGDITSSAPSALQAVKLLATYLHRAQDRGDVMAQAKRLRDDGSSLHNPTVAHVVGTLYLHEQAPEEALKCLHASDALENIALTVQILVKMDRVELARKELKRMQTQDEDATITQLATAWVNVALGGEKLQEAYYIFQEMTDKYDATPLLLNGQAVTHMLRGAYEDAHSCLQSALSLNASDPETLVNLVAVSQYLNKPQEVTQRYINQLKDEAPQNAFVHSLGQAEEAFDRSAARYAPSS